ncbi:hypothetical protein Glove_242g106 [Diversispora epigaea]|uniref:DUF159-domain-containing protein n=1 Tax=Diversispora epigaea TaxID=1348612 RepID=A0A397I9M9_9GLOM|nr:hypothetical protein Glove_242g106 [Diversispora epigaea]
MCYRVAMAMHPDDALEKLENININCADWLDRGNYQTSYNVAPTSYQPVIRMEHGSKQTVVHTMKWGLVPCWSKSLPNSKKIMNTANCRDDSLIGNGKSMFSSMKNAKRCIVLVQGFYEWLHKGKQKIPYYFKRKDGELLFFAGLYDSVRLPDKEELLFTYTIITTSPAKFMSHIHNRMPVILEKESSDDIAKWLNPDIRWNSELAALLKPYEREEELECYQVTQDVNKVGTDSPRFVKPVSQIFESFSSSSPSSSTSNKRENKIKQEDEEIKQEEDESKINIKQEDEDEVGIKQEQKGEVEIKHKQEDEEINIKQEDIKIESSIPSKRNQDNVGDNDDKKEVKQEQFNNSDNEIHANKKLRTSDEVDEDNEEEEEKKSKRKKSTSSIKKKKSVIKSQEQDNAQYNIDDDREDNKVSNESLSKKIKNKKEKKKSIGESSLSKKKQNKIKKQKKE